MDEVLHKLETYEKWARRICLLLLWLMSVILEYRYAFKQGEVYALQTLLSQLEKGSTQSNSVNPRDGEPGQYKGPLEG